MARNRILVVDDDPLIRGSLYEMLRGRRYEVEMASDGSEAMDHLRRHPFHLVISDWKMPQVDGISLLVHIKRTHPEVTVILITGFGNIGSAVQAIRQGAFDYLTKPIQAEELEQTIQRALSQDAVPAEAVDDPFAGIITQDPRVLKLFTMVRAVARTPATVLLEGESGTGKRLIAQAIHRADPQRCHHPFMEVSCGALPETLLESELFGHVKGAFTGAIRDRQGRFEVAEGGTVLLDEIDAFTPALQVKLLRVIQDRVYERVGDTRTLRADVRIIAATNRWLSDLVKQGTLREDLYYRLNVVAIRLPSLRERPGDLPLLTNHFIGRCARAVGRTINGMSEEAMKALADYAWPGNVRELENVIERAVILTTGSVLGVEDLPEAIRSPTGVDREAHAHDAKARTGDPAASAAALREVRTTSERDAIVNVLTAVRWNRTEAAKRLGIHRSTLYHKIRQLEIES